MDLKAHCPKNHVIKLKNILSINRLLLEGASKTGGVMQSVVSTSASGNPFFAYSPPAFQPFMRQKRQSPRRRQMSLTYRIYNSPFINIT